MNSKSLVDEKNKMILQRWFYALVGILTMIPIILFTLEQIRNIKKDNNEFAFYLLLLVHSGLLIFNEISRSNNSPRLCDSFDHFHRFILS
jgi:hypothetical protein